MTNNFFRSCSEKLTKSKCPVSKKVKYIMSQLYEYMENELHTVRVTESIIPYVLQPLFVL